MVKIAKAVIVYFPDLNAFQNIQTYNNLFGKCYIIDNSDSPNEISSQIKSLLNISYLHDGENKGIAIRLNEVCKLAIKDGFDWLLTMDQDSFFDNNSVTKYLECISNFEKKHETAMFGVQYEDAEVSNGLNCRFNEITHLITSGSIINLSLFSTIGAFDENLFIDEVDLEYCLRAIYRGYKIIYFPNIHLNHTLGELHYHRSLKSLKVTPRILHSPIRLYYITRNFFYISKKYKNVFPEEMQRTKKALANRIKNNILYNKKRVQVIKYLVKAIFDYKRNKMGKLHS
jgi:rhamnosyltransferase